MPILRIEEPQYPEIVSVLVKVLKADEKGAFGYDGDEPLFVEEKGYGKNLHVVVIWDGWEGVPADERGGLILDAYREALDEATMLRITLPIGLTKKEAKKIGYEI